MAAPDTFFIPPAARRSSLKVGDVVKLLFFIKEPTPGGVEAERMWVEVSDARRERYAGRLLNSPTAIADLEPGAVIEFGPQHVAAIAVSEAEMGYRVDARAIINRRLAASAFRPQRLQRDEPTHGDDSGWVVLAGDETAEDFSDPARWAATQLGFLTDRHPELEDVFRKGKPGERWEWDEGAARYRRVET